MIKTINMLLDELQKYSSPYDKISRMVKNKEIYPIVKGIYETNQKVSPYLLAGSIYGPSYISFEYALSYYGMIPETVYTVTCATYNKKKKKQYKTNFGNFIYRDIPNEAFPLEIKTIKEEGYYYRIATPEKAICDKVYTLKPIGKTNDMIKTLIEDLRIDESEIKKLNTDSIMEISEYYHATNMKKLCNAIRRIQR